MFNFTFVIFRFFSLYLFVHALQVLNGCINFLISYLYENQMENFLYYMLSEFFYFAILIAVALVVWKKADLFAREMLNNDDKLSINVDTNKLMKTAIVFAGIWIFANAASDLVYDILKVAFNDKVVWYATSIGGSVIKLAISIFLIVRAECLAGLAEKCCDTKK